jgi:hypothetical protein
MKAEKKDTPKMKERKNETKNTTSTKANAS